MSNLISSKRKWIKLLTVYPQCGILLAIRNNVLERLFNNIGNTLDKKLSENDKVL